MAFDQAFEPEPDTVRDLNMRLRDASPEVVVRTALEQFTGRLALVSSFGAESAVLLHLTASIDPSTPVLFLDTGQLFAQTLDYRRALTQMLGLTDVRDLRPAYTDLAVQDPRADLWKTDPDACCHIRKVAPLDRAVDQGFDAWLTGRKRFQSATRARLPVVERGAAGKIKINPLASFSAEALADYAREYDLPAHPLTSHGYPSIGCWPCTQPVEVGADARSGRWAGIEKTECGLHTPRGGGDMANVGGDI
jgi:phosphoadenosine phosphosulfate reductase